MKYRITENSKLFYGTTLYQIQGVDNGELGGWIEKESNLDQEGSCWVYGNALVLGNARVFGDARVFGNAQVFGDAQVYGDARVYGDAQVCGNARVLGNARVFGDAQVFGDAVLSSDKNFVMVSVGDGYTITLTDNHVQIGCEQVGLDGDLYGKLRGLGVKQGINDTRIAAYISSIEGLLLLRGNK